jgi:ubiquinone/menaquinone biosynthesis C-methylase UbiE
VRACDDARMTDQAERYDRIAEGYQRWWAPVLAPTARGLLETIEPLVRTGRERILDMGTGTGTLARATVERWAEVQVDAIDASAGMIAAASDLAARDLEVDQHRRLRFTTAFADTLPFDDATFDLVISSFVIQLVPSRIRALREIRRVLRPGGWLAYVTWLRDEHPFIPDVIFDELLDTIGIGAREPDPRPGDLASPTAAAAQLRRAGFAEVQATSHRLVHAFDPDGYLAFLAEFDEEDLFQDLTHDERGWLSSRLVERLRELPPEDLTLRAPVVTVIGARKG